MKNPHTAQRFAKTYAQFTPPLWGSWWWGVLILSTLAVYSVAYFHDAYSSILNIRELASTEGGGYRPGAEFRREGQCPDSANIAQLCEGSNRNYPQYMRTCHGESHFCRNYAGCQERFDTESIATACFPITFASETKKSCYGRENHWRIDCRRGTSTEMEH